MVDGLLKKYYLRLTTVRGSDVLSLFLLGGGGG